MTGVTSLVDAVFDHQLGAKGAVRIVAIRTGHLAGLDRVGRDPMELRPLALVAGEAHLRLCSGREHSVLVSVDLVTGGAGDIAALVFTSHPMGALPVLVARNARCGLKGYGRGGHLPKNDINRGSGGGPGGILYVCHARAVARLTAGRARIRFYPVCRLIDCQYRFCFGLVVTPGAYLVPLQRSVGLIGQCHRRCAASQQQDDSQQGAAYCLHCY